MADSTYPARNIRNRADVEAFFRWLLHAQGLNFHPDTPFCDYIDYDTGLSLYSPAEQWELDMAMDACFEVCGDEVYVIGGGILKEGKR